MLGAMQPPQTIEKLIALLQQHKTELAKFSVSFLAIFGSMARGDARPDSDIDFLVEFSKPIGLFHIVRFQRFLEGIFGRKVDLVIKSALREEFREQANREMIRAA